MKGGYFKLANPVHPAQAHASTWVARTHGRCRGPTSNLASVDLLSWASTKSCSLQVIEVILAFQESHFGIVRKVMNS